MRVSLKWLGDFVDLPVKAEELAQRLTLAGLEVEGIEHLGRQFTNVVVAEVRARKPHPQADKLTLVTVTDGEGTHEVVCGAPNVPEPGGRVLWARPGAVLPTMQIAKRAVRGVESAGMLCSDEELGLADAPLAGGPAGHSSGIVVLDAELASVRLGTTAQTALGLDDTVLEIGITPNRGDCLSHLGMAREIAALYRLPLKTPSTGLEQRLGDGDVTKLARVRIEAPDGCPRYTARVIQGVRVAPSPRWMRERLRAVGVRPISNLVDVTNYVMFELGQPLHAFDHRRVTESTIVVRHARTGERMHTLDEQERTLEPTDLLICDAKAPVALAGVMGGLGSAIADDTRDVLLESAYFEPRTVRLTSRRLGLKSESSQRFERGIDPNGVERASQRAAALLAELGGGSVARGVIDEYPRRITPRTVALRDTRAREILGLALTAVEQAAHLRSLGLEVTQSGPHAPLSVIVPTHRHDLTREIDLIEEVARMTGYDQVPATLPRTMTSPTAPKHRVSETVRDVLAAAGLRESIGFGFTSMKAIKALRFPDGHPVTRPVWLRNPMTEDQAVMRTSLLAGLLGQLARNQARGARDVRLFEVGHVFYPALSERRSGQSANLPNEPLFVAGVIAGERAGWLKEGGAVDFYDLKGVLEALFAALRLGDVVVSPAREEQAFLHPGVAASVRVGDAYLGAFGEVHPETRDLAGIRTPCFAFELNLDRVTVPPAAQLRAIPRYPSIVRDVSFWIADFEPAAKVERVIRESAPPLLESIRVLDDYREAGKVPQGQKGMLWSLTYRSPERTLTDTEVDSIHEGLVAKLLSVLSASRR